MEFTDTQQAIRDVFRQYMTNELEPRTEAFESGEESIFPFMRKMTKGLGLDAAMGQGDSDGSAGQRAAKALPRRSGYQGRQGGHPHPRRLSIAALSRALVRGIRS